MPAEKTQWNTFASQYSCIESLPCEIVAAQQLRRILGSINGTRILDLACGTGTYGRMALSMGATCIVGIDVASHMVMAGSQMAAADGISDRMTFHVADCSAPLDALQIDERSFDLVMGNWLLSYAANRAELEGMWRNIAMHLKPGGRFVGLVGAFDVDAMSSTTGKYGMKTTVLGEIENGFTIHVEAATEPKIEFDAYALNRALHESAAEKADMVKLDYIHTQKEDLPEGADMKYWREMLDSSPIVVCIAERLES